MSIEVNSSHLSLGLALCMWSQMLTLPYTMFDLQQRIACPKRYLWSQQITIDITTYGVYS